VRWKNKPVFDCLISKQDFWQRLWMLGITFRQHSCRCSHSDK